MKSSRDRYIVSRAYDWSFFILPPLFAMAIGAWMAGGGSGLFIGALIHAHLVAVLIRSHGNPSIRRRHPIAFFVVPVALFVALIASSWLAVLSVVVATFWDVWHSGAQTFGFARIYERNAGNPTDVMRRWDFWLNQVLYAGPILAGITLMDHVSVFEDFGDFDDAFSLFLARAPGEVEAGALELRNAVLIACSLFLAAYVVRAWTHARAGHPPPVQKVVLLVVTGACSIVAWGFNSWGEAFFIMNFFHAVQYLALVWAMEGERATRWLGVSRLRHGQAIAGGALLAMVAGYGIAAETVELDGDAFWALTMVVSLMHFWYDAFIWSVRRAQV